MPDVTAQVSIYPLRTEHLGPAIEDAVARFRAGGLGVWEGPMSTVIAGDLDLVCASLRDAFAAAAANGELVLVVTISNGCPVPDQTSEAGEQASPVQASAPDRMA